MECLIGCSYNPSSISLLQVCLFIFLLSYDRFLGPWFELFVVLFPDQIFFFIYVFFGTNFYLIEVDIRTDIDDRPYMYTIHGKVNDMSRFLLPDLLQ